MALLAASDLSESYRLVPRCVDTPAHPHNPWPRKPYEPLLSFILHSLCCSEAATIRAFQIHRFCLHPLSLSRWCSACKCRQDGWEPPAWGHSCQLVGTPCQGAENMVARWGVGSGQRVSLCHLRAAWQSAGFAGNHRQQRTKTHLCCPAPSLLQAVSQTKDRRSSRRRRETKQIRE